MKLVNNVENQPVLLRPLGSSEELFIIVIIVITVLNFIIIRTIIYMFRHHSHNFVRSFFSYKDPKTLNGSAVAEMKE